MGRAEDLFESLAQRGESALDEFIQARQHEELFLDFKRGNGGAPRFADADRANLARAVSGFGNTEGGVVVWGVDCRGLKGDSADVARGKIALDDAKRFVSWVEGAVSGCTVPPHLGVRSHAIVMAEAPHGYAVTLIPASVRAPHQVTGEGRYYIRAGSSFSPAPHGLVASMFGRKPAPLVELDVSRDYSHCTFSGDPPSLRLRLALVLRNRGVTMLRDFFLVLRWATPAGFTLEESKWGKLHRDAGPRRVQVTARDDARLAPGSEFVMQLVAFPFWSPVPGARNEAVDFTVTFGADGAPVQERRFHWTVVDLERIAGAVVVAGGGDHQRTDAAFMEHLFPEIGGD